MGKSQDISGHDLLALGVPEGRGFGEELQSARMKLAGGEAWENVAREIRARAARRKDSPAKLSLREGAKVAVAADPSGAEEEENIRAAVGKMNELVQVPVVTGAAIMPDACPSGSEWGSIPVGGVVVTKNSVIPGAHSADVNCGMFASFFDSRAGISELMRALKESTLFGPFPARAGQESPSPVLQENVWSNPFLKGLEHDALRYLGTQGDGNHFSYLGEIEVEPALVDKLENIGHGGVAAGLAPYRGQRLWVLVTHHGSRNFGAKVYRRGVDAAERYTASVATGIPKNAAWLDLGTSEGQAYWEALEYVGRWTTENHETIHRKFLAKVEVERVAAVANHHNAVWRREGAVYHGKGATPAWKDDGIPRLGIIPLNMGREILLIEGGDNRDFYSFAPHGAGRNKSRRATKEAFCNPDTGEIDRDLVAQSLEEQTRGIEVAWASGVADISESPIGYKSATKVRADIEKFGLGKVVAEVRPRGCMMAGEFQRGGRERVKGKNIELRRAIGSTYPGGGVGREIA